MPGFPGSSACTPGHRIRNGAFDKGAALLVALLCLAAGWVLASYHPVAPSMALAAFVGWSAAVAWQPRIWLFAVPAMLPLLNFAPWTGWRIVEEFDLLLLGAAIGGYAHLALGSRMQPDRGAGQSRIPAAFAGAALLFALASVVSLGRGVSAAGGLASPIPGWFHGDAEPLNSWRSFKSVAWAALLWPLLRHEVRVDARGAARRLAAGVLAGLAIVILAIVWERAAYPGLWNFTAKYRTVALFWEMHLGGAAVDAYLALTTPFVAWALVSARSPWRWCAAAALALLTGYACLTTFSRGVYVAVALPLVLLGVLMLLRRADGQWRACMLHALAIGAALLVAALALGFAFDTGGWIGSGALLLALTALWLALGRWIKPLRRRRLAALALVLALLLEGVAVLGLGTFMRERLAASDHDVGGRLAHWQRGLGLVQNTPDWIWGIGTGRLPAAYVTRGGEEFPGTAQWLPGPPGGSAAMPPGSVRLFGPKTRPDLNGLLALAQRVALRPNAGHQTEFDVRAATPAVVYVAVCEMHLLYPRECQQALIHIAPEIGAPWRHVSLRLRGSGLTRGEPWLPRRAVFSIAVLNPGGSAEFRRLGLIASDRMELLVNGDFARGLAHWMPAARGHFVPWHVDNLYLELLIERGLPALLAFLACMGVVLWRLLGAAGRAQPMAPFLAASLCGALCVGLVSSVMDAPRVAFLLLLLTVFAVELTGAPPALSDPASPAAPAA